MFARIIGSALRGGRCSSLLKPSLINNVEMKSTNLVSQFNANVNNTRNASTLLSTSSSSSSLFNGQTSLLKKNNLLTSSSVISLAGNVPARNVTKYSRTNGKRKVVQTVLRRFYRLNWGIWIRTKTGRHKRLWTKRGSCKRRSRMHVFTNATQSYLLDKMVSPFWRAPKYWVDDPYNPYHQREEFWITRKAPQP